MTSSAFLRGQEHAPLPRPPAGAPFDVIFLDRDGTLNVLRPGYRTPGDFDLIEGAVEAVARLNAVGIPVVLVTNQQGLGTGRLTWEELDGVHGLLLESLREHNAHLDDIRLCPHPAGTCACRKPQPGMLLEVLQENPWVQAERCVMIGDSSSDAQAARAAGVSYRQVDGERTVAEVVNDICSANGITPP